MRSEDIGRLRMISQGVIGSAFTQPDHVVRHLCAVQAQDFLGSLWAVGARLPGACEAQVEAALNRRAIIRTWPMRGTIHLLAAEDARWMLGLLAPRVVQSSQSRLRQLGLDAKILMRGEEVVCRALEGGRHLTRPQLYAVLEEAGIAVDASRGLHILGQLAHQRLICFGVRAGKQPTFTLLDEWVPHSRTLARDEALAELSLRYMLSHGPATIRDLMWWAGLTLAEARVGLAAVSDQLRQHNVDGQIYYLARDLVENPGHLPGIAMLAPFDEFLIAYRDRSASISAVDMERVAPGRNGIFNPIVVADGQVIGAWKRAIRSRYVEVEFAPFMSWDEARQRAARAAAEEYAAFLGLPAA